MILITDLLPLLLAWGLDLWLGDPIQLPHLVVGFGKLIAKGERVWNKGKGRLWKGALMAIILVVATFVISDCLLGILPGVLHTLVSALLIFYCMAGTTLIREVREVFRAVDRSLEEGRVQVARIVGRDTSELSAQEVRTAALETLAENLSDEIGRAHV